MHIFFPDKDKDTDSISSLDSSNIVKPEVSPTLPLPPRNINDEMSSSPATSQAVDRDHLEEVLSSFPPQATPEVEQEGSQLQSTDIKVDGEGCQEIHSEVDSKEVHEVTDCVGSIENWVRAIQFYLTLLVPMRLCLVL